MKTAVIGLGSRNRGDDAIGLLTIDRLARFNLDADLHAWERSALDLLELLPQYDRVIIVDAAHDGSPIGTLHHDIDVAADPAAVGNHGFDLAGVLELAEALGRVPDDLHLMLVEVGSLDHGAVLSPAVNVALDDVVGRLVRALDPGDADVSRGAGPRGRAARRNRPSREG